MIEFPEVAVTGNTCMYGSMHSSWGTFHVLLSHSTLSVLAQERWTADILKRRITVLKELGKTDIREAGSLTVGKARLAVLCPTPGWKEGAIIISSAFLADTTFNFCHAAAVRYGQNMSCVIIGLGYR